LFAALGVAFSFGIPMAFAAVQGQAPLPAWLMLGRDDDLKIGMKTSANTQGLFDRQKKPARKRAFSIAPERLRRLV
jgi:hypothetical protein